MVDRVLEEGLWLGIEGYIKLEKARTGRPLIVPRYGEVGQDIILGLIRTAGIDYKAFLELLEHC